MTEQTTTRVSVFESTISMQARNAFMVAVLLILGALLNLGVSLSTAFETPSIFAFVDSIAVFAFLIVTIVTASMVRRGKKDQGIRLLLGSLLLTLIVRNALMAGLGAVFGLLILSLLPLVAILTLNPSEFNVALFIGLVAGSLLLVFDLLAPPYRQILPTNSSVLRSISVLAGLVTIILAVAVTKYHNQILLSSKITLGFVVVVIVPILALQAVGTITLSNALIPRQNTTLLSNATLAASKIDGFINNIIQHDLPFEAQSPIFPQYLDAMKIAREQPVNHTLFIQAREQLETFQNHNTAAIGSDNIKSYALLDATGENVLDTIEANIGTDESGTDYFLSAYKEERTFVTNTEYKPLLASTYLTFSTPVYTEDSRLIGVLRVQYDAQVLHTLLAEFNNYADHTYAILLNKTSTAVYGQILPEISYITLAHGSDPDLVYKVITQAGTTVITTLQTSRQLPPGTTPQLSLDLPELDIGLRHVARAPVFIALSQPADDLSQRNVIAASPLQTQPWIVLISQDLSVFNAPISQQRRAITLVSVLIALVTPLKKGRLPLLKRAKV